MRDDQKLAGPSVIQLVPLKAATGGIGVRLPYVEGSLGIGSYEG